MGYEQAYMPSYDASMHLTSPTHPFSMQQSYFQDPYYTDDNTLFYVSPVEPTAPQQLSTKGAEEEAAEDEDTSSRPRLSPDQLAILEEHFQSHQKPNTDFKKQLAEQLGLSLSRVNNWYQNRRAKQRHQRPQTRRFDVYPDENSGLWLQPTPSYLGIHDHPGNSSTVMDSVPILSSTEMISPENGMDHSLTDIDQMMLPHNGEEVVPASTTFPGQDLTHDFMDVAFPPLPDSPDLDLLNLEVGPEQKHLLGTEGRVPPSLYCLTSPLYPGTSSGVPMGNLSTQSFTTFGSSPDDQHPNLITPPENPSPVSFVTLDNIHRRPSVTSDLTSNMDHIQLQHQPSHQGINSIASRVDPAVPAFEPSTFSPEQLKLEVTDKRPQHNDGSNSISARTSSVPNIDLASRRKRPRPAALRPEVNRSHSYNGPMTMSPTSRTPTLLSVDSPSVRRIRSTGQNLNIFNGRIMKPSSMAAQLSPRNIQSCMEDAMSVKSNSVTPRTGGAIAPLTPQTSESFPTSAAHTTSSNASIGYPSHQHSDEAGMFIQSPPITPFGVSQNPMDFPVPQHVASQMPPQSAPPTRTTFFQDSPNVGPQQAPQGHLTWQSTEPLPSGPPGLIMPEHGCYHHRHSHSQSPPHISQDSRSTYEMHPPMFYSHPHQLPLGMAPPVSAQYYDAPAPQPQKDLEIQVTTIPQPKGPIQGPRTFTFSNVTPKDFDTPSNGSTNNTAAR